MGFGLWLNVVCQPCFSPVVLGEVLGEMRRPASEREQCAWGGRAGVLGSSEVGWGGAGDEA